MEKFIESMNSYKVWIIVEIGEMLTLVLQKLLLKNHYLPLYFPLM